MKRISVFFVLSYRSELAYLKMSPMGTITGKMRSMVGSSYIETDSHEFKVTNGTKAYSHASGSVRLFLGTAEL